jgi:hypothetical protein
LTALVGLAIASLVLTACFGPGLHSVGTPLTSTQMPPGLWRSLGGNDCTWARVRATGVAGRNIRTKGPQYMQVDVGDKGTAIGNCFPFWQQPGPFAKPFAQPGSDFGDGDFLVGYELAPGTYTAPGGGLCNWAAVSGFHGKDSSNGNPDFIRGGGGGAPTAQIASSDYGFTSQDCGTWHYVSSAQPPPPGTPPAVDPVFHVADEDFPDPFVMRVDEKAKCGGDPAPCYYAYSTEAGFLGLINVPVIRSSDLVNWKWAGPPAPGQTAARKDAMPTLGSWVSFGGNWAPSVMFNTTLGKYVMYYTALSKPSSSTGGRECVGVATSSAPDGPFVDALGTPLTCAGAGDNIDPSPFVGSDNSLSLQWADNVAIRSQQLTADGLGLTGDIKTLLTGALLSWESGRVEAPSLVRAADGRTLLFYSGNVFDNPKYAVGVAQCDSALPASECTRLSPSPILTSSQAPGGQTPFQFKDGSWRLAYHAWAGVVGYPSGRRILHITTMTIAASSTPSFP